MRIPKTYPSPTTVPGAAWLCNIAYCPTANQEMGWELTHSKERSSLLCMHTSLYARSYLSKQLYLTETCIYHWRDDELNGQGI
ncbi:hypothetical protein GDO78_020317 [Eleutherodactylus coqui]|uniref:Uncharacterized protein n=1 Tax=Eleutherodactylus coqui TaxID=57060 RepID=A0A8J6BCX1_ELECQ|nr:hypothetical protein GDO78_020317 [Eleutherodactylus coqui]